MSTANTYTEPVSRLLSLGAPDQKENYHSHGKVRDYLPLGFSAEHVPELLRMLTDDFLWYESDPDEAESYAPIHAWRVLGQIGDPAAIAPLISLLPRVDEDNNDWIGEDFPGLLARFGPAAIAPIEAFINGDESPTYAIVAAQEALKEIALLHPETRPHCVEFLSEILHREAFPGIEEEDARVVRSFTLSSLIDLGAQEALPAIEAAFKKYLIDLSIAGDLEEVQVELGLLEKRLTPKPNFQALERWHANRAKGVPMTTQEVELPPLNPADFRLTGPGKTPKQSKKSKSKNKMAKASKKKNRKR